MRAVPWFPDGSDGASDNQVGIERPAEMVPRDPGEVLMENKVARTNLRRADFEQWGLREGCPGCRYLRTGQERQQAHSEPCRRRIEGLLKGDAADERINIQFHFQTHHPFPTQIHAHFIPSGTRFAQLCQDSCFLHDTNLVAKQRMDRSSRTLTLRQVRAVCTQREPTGQMKEERQDTREEKINRRDKKSEERRDKMKKKRENEREDQRCKKRQDETKRQERREGREKREETRLRCVSRLIEGTYLAILVRR